MNEQLAHVNGLELAYETFGDRTRRPLLLIMGLGAQMINWDEDFCALLAERDFHVIRFDNRDVGRSSRVEGGPRPDLQAILGGDCSSRSYLLSDMAADAAGLLDVLGFHSAHVVGASMGGMIAQTLAIEHPARVRSLCSIMSSTGDRSVGMPDPAIMWVLSESRPSDREGGAAHHARVYRAIGSPGYPPQEARLLERGRQSFDRGLSAAGYMRQVAAIACSGDRTAALEQLDVPTLVIHGREDPLIGVSGGEATARAIPASRLLLFAGMGHDLPRALWDQFAEAIELNAGVAA